MNRPLAGRPGLARAPSRRPRRGPRRRCSACGCSWRRRNGISRRLRPRSWPCGASSCTSSRSGAAMRGLRLPTRPARGSGPPKQVARRRRRTPARAEFGTRARPARGRLQWRRRPPEVAAAGWLAICGNARQQAAAVRAATAAETLAPRVCPPPPLGRWAERWSASCMHLRGPRPTPTREPRDALAAHWPQAPPPLSLPACDRKSWRDMYMCDVEGIEQVAAVGRCESRRKWVTHRRGATMSVDLAM
mmetsp:Transcript_29317/g.83377  ORF Transcript_29317/g.83377 Transcript_29317/m.83377 type:complete len:247 (+) Transcript_29317:387-1127(+)